MFIADLDAGDVGNLDELWLIRPYVIPIMAEITHGIDHKLALSPKNLTNDVVSVDGSPGEMNIHLGPIFELNYAESVVAIPKFCQFGVNSVQTCCEDFGNLLGRVLELICVANVQKVSANVDVVDAAVHENTAGLLGVVQEVASRVIEIICARLDEVGWTELSILNPLSSLLVGRID